MKWTPFLLPVVVIVLLSGVYLLPSAGEVAQSAIIMKLPMQKGTWKFDEKLPSKEEIDALAKDTEFSKAICSSTWSGRYNQRGEDIPDRIDLSIVLSGSDINNSIHRPERCMPAQGHTIYSSSDLSLEMKGQDSLPMKRLVSMQRLPLNQDGTEFMEMRCITYYFFVGHDSFSNSHLERTLIDMKDRLIKGLDQRWAYVSVSTWYGKIPWMEDEISEQEADQLLVNFMKDFSSEQIDWNQIK